VEDKQRLKELADRSYSQGQYTFTDFLSLAEQSVFYECERELFYAHPTLYGGCDIAERKMIRFGSEEELGYVQAFPISAIRIRPVMFKFSDDLNHRDFLGALMNLGIKREMLGDIFVKGNEACVFCKDSLAGFISENLTRIKHTSVRADVTDDVGDITKPVLEDKLIQVSSVRIDAVISRIYNLSRQEALDLFPGGLVFLNGRECTENARQLKANDIVSVRGKGKFEFVQETGLSRKGKINCKVRIYA
jgi:RNA-binding protein YlmH